MEPDEVTTARPAIIAADVHLKRKPGLWSGRSEIAGDDEYALQQICDLAIEQEADLYFLGDSFDRVTNLPRPSVIAQRHVGRVLAAGSGVVRFIQGNHDMVIQQEYATEPWLSMVSGLHTGNVLYPEHIHGTRFDFCGLPAYALDYFPSPQAEEALSAVPDDVLVLMLHGTIDLAMPMSAHFRHEQLPRSLKYVFAGDWHHQAKFAPPDGPSVLYPGSAYMNSVSERGDKYVFLVTPDGDSISVSTYPLQHRHVYSIAEDLPDTIEKIAELVAEDAEGLPGQIARPIFLLDDADADAVLVDRLSKMGHLYGVRSRAAEEDQPSQTVADTESNEELLTAYMDPEAEPDVFAFTLDVIENPAEDALARLREHLGVSDDDVTTMCTTAKAQADSDETMVSF